MAQEYVYEPLESEETIRILVLHPSTMPSSPLEADIEHKPRRSLVDGHPRMMFQDYTAISYHWGPAKFSHDLVCGERRLAITSTVNDMLRRLRKHYKQRRLWIDAICLNQADATEKAVQIQLMRQIYQEAQKVIVWLGEPARVLSSLKESGTILHECKWTPSVESDTISALRYLQITRCLPEPRLCLLLELLMLNPYFKRRWVIQEATAHSHTVVYHGVQKFAWVELSSGFDALASGLRLSDVTQAALEQVHKMRNPPEDLLSLVLEFHSFECGDNRDESPRFKVSPSTSLETVCIYGR